VPKVKVEFKTSAPLSKIWLEDEELKPDNNGVAEATVSKRKTPYLLTWMVRGTPSDTYQIKVVEPKEDAMDSESVKLGADKIGVGIHPIYKGTQP
jgi:hypothetical protein